MPRTTKHCSLIERIRRARHTVARCYRICRWHAARLDGRWLDDCFAWGWLDH